MPKQIVTVIVDGVNFRTMPSRGDDQTTLIRTLTRGEVLDFIDEHLGTQLNWIKVIDRKTGKVGFVSVAKNGVRHVAVSDARLPPLEKDNDGFWLYPALGVVGAIVLALIYFLVVR